VGDLNLSLSPATPNYKSEFTDEVTGVGRSFPRAGGTTSPLIPAAVGLTSYPGHSFVGVVIVGLLGVRICVLFEDESATNGSIHVLTGVE